ncbi:glycosyltransferase family 2 protein [Thalassotalea sp. PLHSN55]|uniref:glycosyltransferase family 2 protein n=1 Tax=Thalassotalea sp. PLHSN55 TaxID=3435888 RepID=UPI003F82B8AB
MSYCFIIPNYNHIGYIETLIQSLERYNFPIVMVNDASEASVKEKLIAIEANTPQLTLLNHEVNQGKGGAVQTGLLYAEQQGYDFAIQIDADGQHCLDDIDTMLSMSKTYPEYVISGKPIYDESIPKHRYWARYITHFWVMIETLSTKLKDTMCGYRVYPVKASVKLIQEVSLGKRMDFDIEILVRLFWRGVESKFVDTKVIYPEAGISHFRAFEDNVRISWMHTKLCIGMLVRSPMLLKRKFQ